jgi:SAM-dependent methyltransferase
MEPNAEKFFIDKILVPEIMDKRLLDVGSRLIDTSLKPMIMNWYRPKEYIGIDIIEGTFVDKICAAENIVAEFGENSFDFVMCVEAMEHIEHWREAISNMKRCCKPDGVVFITTRRPGWMKHDYPSDWWRYTMGDMENLFADYNIESIERDSFLPYTVNRFGVFIKARKPIHFIEVDLSGYDLTRV